MIRAIIFDFDGTILDTETASYHAWIHFYNRYGLTMPIQKWGRFIGTKNKEDTPYTFLVNHVADFVISEKDVRLEIKQMVTSTMASRDLLPGVKELLQYARNNHIRLAIATSSSRETVLEHLKRFNLEAYFDVLSTSDDVAKVKPDPEIYLRAIEALQVAKEEVIAIEDSPNGALAAKRAGIRCVVVPNDITKFLSFPQVDGKLESLKDFDLDLVNIR